MHVQTTKTVQTVSPQFEEIDHWKGVLKERNTKIMMIGLLQEARQTFRIQLFLFYIPYYYQSKALLARMKLKKFQFRSGLVHVHPTNYVFVFDWLLRGV